MASTSLATAQTLFSASDRVAPGQSFNVTGSGFDQSTRLTIRRYGPEGKLGNPLSVNVTDQSDFGLLATMPDRTSFGLYKLESASAKGAGESMLINAPRIQWMDAKVSPIDSTVRIVGRNFRPANGSYPSARLVDAATGMSITATVTAATDYDATIRIPSRAVAGRTYRILLNSNLAGPASEVTAPEMLTVSAKGEDPFSLGTAWASDFEPISDNVYNLKTDSRLPYRATGNGSTDDSNALQTAIVYAASKGGGTIYIPAGVYRMDSGTMIQMRPKVVLKGDGMGTTIIETGNRFTSTVAPPANFYAFQFVGGANSGMVDLTFKNKSSNAVPIGLLRGAASSSTTNRSFLKNVAFESNNGLPINLGKVREGLVAGCRIVNTSTANGPLDLNGARNLRFSGNSIDYRVGRVMLGFGYRNVIEGNAMYINNAYQVPGSVESGGMELSFSQEVLVTTNRVAGYGPTPTKDAVDGELIMAQRSVVPDYWDAGKVASVSGLKLFPTGRNWSNNWLSSNHDDLGRSYVAIVRGKGMGQWRRVTSHDASSLTVDTPWKVAPDSTSTYAVGTFVALGQTWINNSVANGSVGLQLWNGGIDCAIANNTVTDAGAVMVRGSSQPAPTAQGTISQCVAWNIDVRSNKLATTSNRTAASVTVSGFITRPIADRDAVGSLVLGVDVIGNQAAGSFYKGTNPLSQYDGFELVTVRELPGFVDPILHWGTVLADGTVTGSLKSLRLLNVSTEGVDATLVSATPAVTK